MFFVLCPCCESCVEVPSDAADPKLQQLWNVIVCETCDAAFDYDDDDVRSLDDLPAQFVA